MPEWVEKLAASGRLGDKTRRGFYKKVGKDITTLDWKTLEYGPQQKVEDPALAALHEAAARAAADVGDAAARQVRRVRAQLSAAHVALRAEDDARRSRTTSSSVDRAIEWGYAWEAGPFQQMDALGHDFLREGFARLGLDVPPLLAEGEGRRVLPRETRAAGRISPSTGTYAPVPPVPGQISLDQVRARKGAVVETLEGREPPRPRRRRAAARGAQQDEHDGRRRARACCARRSSASRRASTRGS